MAETDPQAPALDIQSWQTGEGAKVLFVASDALPMLDIRLVSDAGSARDGAHPGLASLTSALLGEGADGMSVDDIARGFEDQGASFSSSSYRDMGVISLRTLSEARTVTVRRWAIGDRQRLVNTLARIRTQMMQNCAETDARPAGEQGLPGHGVY